MIYDRKKITTHTYRIIKYIRLIYRTYFVPQTLLNSLKYHFISFYQPKKRRLFFFGIQNETDICKKKKKTIHSNFRIFIFLMIEDSDVSVI